MRICLRRASLSGLNFEPGTAGVAPDPLFWLFCARLSPVTKTAETRRARRPIRGENMGTNLLEAREASAALDFNRLILALPVDYRFVMLRERWSYSSLQ